MHSYFSLREICYTLNMYLGVDIGGTKTLVATLSDDGVIIDSRRFPSDHDYQQFLRNLEQNLNELQLDDNLHCCVGVPGLLDRTQGIAHALGNLPWQEVPIRDDISKLINGQKVIIENDTPLAGLSEAQLIKDRYDDVIYITVSTGIGVIFIQNGRIAKAVQDMELGKMPLLHDNEYVPWEEYASGHAIAKHFNKEASEITDPDEWHLIGDMLAPGIAIACSVFQPTAIVLGGGVGRYADNFIPVIKDFLDKNLHAVIRKPEIILPAQRPDEAVIYGCYDYAKQVYGHG